MLFHIVTGTTAKENLPPRLWRIFTGVQHTVCLLLLIWWGSLSFYIDPILDLWHTYILIYFAFLVTKSSLYNLYTLSVSIKSQSVYHTLTTFSKHLKVCQKILCVIHCIFISLLGCLRMWQDIGFCVCFNCILHLQMTLLLCSIFFKCTNVHMFHFYV